MWLNVFHVINNSWVLCDWSLEAIESETKLSQMYPTFAVMKMQGRQLNQKVMTTSHLPEGKLSCKITLKIHINQNESLSFSAHGSV